MKLKKIISFVLSAAILITMGSIPKKAGEGLGLTADAARDYSSYSIEVGEV